MSPTRHDAPNPAVRRLSLYLRQLEALHERSVRTVSSRRLAETLALTDAQVRKDLAYFGQFGRPGVGYEVDPLIHRLRHILGTDTVSNTVLIGTGNLGRALAAYDGFVPKGFQLVACFDGDEKKVGKKVGPMTTQPMKELAATVTKLDVRLAILAVPAEAAQPVADALAKTTIRGILNFAPVRLKVPDTIGVRALDVAAELEQLSFLTRID